MSNLTETPNCDQKPDSTQILDLRQKSDPIQAQLASLQAQITGLVAQVSSLQTQLDNTTRGANPSNLSFSKLPPEIRTEIFKLVITDQEGNSPALIRALRGGDPTIYKEALQVFYAINTYNVPSQRFPRRAFAPVEYLRVYNKIECSLPEDLLCTVQKLCIYMTGAGLKNGNLHRTTGLTGLTNLRELRIVITLQNGCNRPPEIDSMWIALPKKVKKVTIGPVTPWLQLSIEDANEYFGALGKLDCVLNVSWGRETWFWEAKKGEFLAPGRDD